MDNRIIQKPVSIISKKPWFLAFRSVTAILLVIYGANFLKSSAFNITLLSLYTAFTLIYILYNFASRYYSEEYMGSIVIIILACELLIEGLLVNEVGGNFSPFILFFIMTIISSAPFFHLVGSIITSTIAGLLYALPIFFDLSNIYEGIIEPAGLAGMGISSDEAFYTVFLHLCLFYFFAFISGYFAERLFFTSRELTNIKLETEEILEQMRSGLMTVNAEGMIVYFNHTAGRLLNIDPEYARGKNIDEVLLSGLDEFKRYIVNGLRAGKAEARSELTIRHPRQGETPIGLSSSILRDNDKNLRGIIILFQDLTEAKRLNERIMAADRLAAVGQMAAGIAHEIRNPLASISGSVEVLRDELHLEGDNDRLLQLILKESSRLNTILSDFLNFARISKAPSGRCDLSAVINELKDLIKGDNGIAKNIKISFEVQRPVLMVVGVEDQIKQILWNLILNAAQALGNEGGTILIATEDCQVDSRYMVKLKVTDNGPGIPEDTRKRMFDPFFTTRIGGTGLGLPIVARIVDCLGGRIDVESSSGVGASFSVYLPREFAPKAQDDVLQEVVLS
ncbi:MAG: PAS domain-containing protein [Candidatus Zixiibacteriota bacterium]|nr:MAG: PAS domain-containing protein [candidate division Zixibacteria bacterium]